MKAASPTLGLCWSKARASNTRCRGSARAEKNKGTKKNREKIGRDDENERKGFRGGRRAPTRELLTQSIVPLCVLPDSSFSSPVFVLFGPPFFFFPTCSWRAKKHTVLIFLEFALPKRTEDGPSTPPRHVPFSSVEGKRAEVSPTLEIPQHRRCFGLTWHIAYGGGLLSCARLPWPELAARCAIRFALGRGRGPERQTCISSAARGARRDGLSVRKMAAAHGQRPGRAKAEGFLFLYISLCLTCCPTFYSAFLLFLPRLALALFFLSFFLFLPYVARRQQNYAPRRRRP